MKLTLFLGGLAILTASPAATSPAPSPKARQAEKFPQTGFSTLNGGTTGGGVPTSANTFTAQNSTHLLNLLKTNTPKTIYIAKPITLSARPKIGNNTSLIGVGKNGVITGRGFGIEKARNVIVRNLHIKDVVGNDAISLRYATNVWIDHCEFSSNLKVPGADVDYYDGQVDVTQGSDYVTLSYNWFHDHYKSSLVGGDPSATNERGKYHITYHHNHFQNISTRTPALRFSTAHVYNNLYTNITAQGIHPRSYAQALVERNVFINVREPISTYGKVIPEDSPNTSPEGDYEPDGFVNERENDYSLVGMGSYGNNITQVGTLTSVGYTYVMTQLVQVREQVLKDVGIGKL